MLLSFQTKQRLRNKLCFAEKINQENIRCGLAGGVSVKTVRAGRRILTKFNKQRQLITGPHTHVADTALRAVRARGDRNTNHSTLSTNTGWKQNTGPRIEPSTHPGQIGLHSDSIQYNVMIEF